MLENFSERVNLAFGVGFGLVIGHFWATHEWDFAVGGAIVALGTLITANVIVSSAKLQVVGQSDAVILAEKVKFYHENIEALHQLADWLKSISIGRLLSEDIKPEVKEGFNINAELRTKLGRFATNPIEVYCEFIGSYELNDTNSSQSLSLHINTEIYEMWLWRWIENCHASQTFYSMDDCKPSQEECAAISKEHLTRWRKSNSQ